MHDLILKKEEKPNEIIEYKNRCKRFEELEKQLKEKQLADKEYIIELLREKTDIAKERNAS